MLTHYKGVNEKMTTYDEDDGSGPQGRGPAYWRDGGKKGLVFAKPEDFIADMTIEESITTSYKKFIDTANTALFTQNEKGYFETGWQAIDKDSKYMYKATWDPRYHYGVMRVHAPKPKPADNIAERLDSIESGIATILKKLDLIFPGAKV